MAIGGRPSSHLTQLAPALSQTLYKFLLRLSPGVLSSFGPGIGEAFGRVHWANTEHSVSYNTYVEGAVRSAEAVAGRVLAEL